MGKRKGNEETHRAVGKGKRVIDSSHRSEEESRSGDADYARLENEQNRGGSHNNNSKVSNSSCQPKTALYSWPVTSRPDLAGLVSL